jgi:LemA protein
MLYWLSWITLGVIALIFIVIYNKFVINRNHVKDAWSNIDVFLKKRYELIPLLVSTVKGYTHHELNTLEKVTQARTQAMLLNDTNLSEKAKSEQELTTLVRQMTIVQEQYPELKADFSYLQLQKDLAKLEVDLEKSRRYYNACVRENNTFGESFPGHLFAGIMGYKKYEFFQFNASENKVTDENF